MAKFAGVVVINKEKGYTSHDVVAILKRLYNEKAGHTGTLDPNATGVLPICIGKATKLANYFLSDTKVYIAEVILGVTTDTGDITGTITECYNNSYMQNGENTYVREMSLRQTLKFTPQKIEETLESFKGRYMQTPPMYSAIKIGGRKLYEIARSGETVERKPRPVEIYGIELLEFHSNSFTISVECSKGTYIRSLCTDIGEKLGCGATMGELQRTRSGQFGIDRALTINDVKNTDNIWRLVTPVEELLPYPAAVLQPSSYNSAKNGNPVKLSDLYRVDITSQKHWLQADSKTIGLFSKRDDSLVCEVML